MGKVGEWRISAAPGLARASFDLATPFKTAWAQPFEPFAFDGVRPHPVPPFGTADAFVGTAGNDDLTGTDNDDSFDLTQGGRDKVDAGKGSDTIDFGATLTAADRINGGSDPFSSTGTCSADVLDLSGDYSAGLTFGAKTVRKVEIIFLAGGNSYAFVMNDGNVAAGSSLSILGTSLGAAFSLHVDASAETDGNYFIRGGLGDDVIVGGQGNDSLGARGGNDFLDGGDGFDRVSLSGASTGATIDLRIQGAAQSTGLGAVTLVNMEDASGSTHADTLIGNDTGNWFITGGGNDTVRGLGGDDLMSVTFNNGLGDPNTDVRLIGGNGRDTAGFSIAGFLPLPEVAAVADLSEVGPQDTGYGVVTFVKIENLAGSAFNDILSGNDHGNILYGDAGDDRLGGGGGSDTLYGDKAYGDFTHMREVFDRGEGDDVLQGGKGDDLMDGGLGSDTADYSDATASVSVSLVIAGAQAVGGGRGFDTLVSIENLAGSDFADLLTGDSNANQLEGGAISDTLSGADGDDVLYGDDAAGALAVVGLELISTNEEGDVADGETFRASLSADDNLIAFVSAGSNLVANDTDGFENVFVKNLGTGEVTQASPAADGNSFDDNAYQPVISADGSKVLWESAALNMVPGDTNNDFDVFITDLASGTVTRLSTGDGGEEADGGSEQAIFMPDGHSVLFQSFASNLDGDTGDQIFGVFIKDLDTGEVTRVSTTEGGQPADGYSAAVSPDGNLIAFRSWNDYLAPDDTNDADDIFIKNLTTGEVTRVSTASDGTEGDDDVDGRPQFSFDGGKIVFTSLATNLVAGDTQGAFQIYVKDLATGETVCASSAADGTLANADSENAFFAHSGRYVAFDSYADNLVAGDTNGGRDVFIKDLVTGGIVRVTLPGGQELSTGGFRAYTFSSDDTTLYISASSPELTGYSFGKPQIYAVHLDTPDVDAGGDDTLNGGDGMDTLIGGAGADTMDGGADADVFLYQDAAESTGPGFDTVVGVDFTQDAFDVPDSVSGVDGTIAAGELSMATFDANLAASADAAHLDAHHAVLFTPDSGDLNGQLFMVVDVNGDAGYQGGEDIVVRLDGAVNLASLGIEDFI